MGAALSNSYEPLKISETHHICHQIDLSYWQEELKETHLNFLLIYVRSFIRYKCAKWIGEAGYKATNIYKYFNPFMLLLNSNSILSQFMFLFCCMLSNRNMMCTPKTATFSLCKYMFYNFKGGPRVKTPCDCIYIWKIQNSSK